MDTPDDYELTECPDGWITLVCPGCEENIWADPRDAEGFTCCACDLELVPISQMDGGHRRIN
jgi:hypothetical protein